MLRAPHDTDVADANAVETVRSVGYRLREGCTTEPFGGPRPEPGRSGWSRRCGTSEKCDAEAHPRTFEDEKPDVV
jgi:hypothetical protein